MEEIKVGEYVRSDSGIILKYEYLKKYEDEVCFGQKGKCWSFEDEEEFEDFIEQRIIKHGSNIIDLIEEGDYVNGEKVIEIDSFKDWIDIGEEVLRQENVKSILTKEQFNQMKYIVGDESNVNKGVD